MLLAVISWNLQGGPKQILNYLEIVIICCTWRSLKFGKYETNILSTASKSKANTLVSHIEVGELTKLTYHLQHKEARLTNALWSL